MIQMFMAQHNPLQLQMVPAQPRDNHLLTAITLRPSRPGIVKQCLTVTLDHHRQPLPDIQHRHPPFVRRRLSAEWPRQQNSTLRHNAGECRQL